MSSRAITLLAWAMFALSLAFIAAGVVFFVLNGATPVKAGWGPRGFQAMFALANILVGAAISIRHPRNMIGWLFIGTGLANALSYFAEEYAVYAVLSTRGLAPLGVEAAWVRNWLWIPASIPVVFFLPLLFPNGRLPSRRWRPVVWLVAGCNVLATVAWLLLPGPFDNFPDLNNPFGIEGARDMLFVLFAIANVVSFTATLVAVVSLIGRFRHTTGAERQQIKWLAYASLLLVAAAPASAFQMPWSLLTIASYMGIPIAAGVAILRYHLYDIDLLINRTLVYGLLTISLALIYVGGVVGLQSLFQPLVGQGNDLAIVISTLAIAALFLPLRRRIQGFIDHRFYRRKYDAARTLAQFSDTVRDEVDLNELTGRLVGVVQETMQPAHVSLWLRPTSENA